jgi:hypothetical protein
MKLEHAHETVESNIPLSSIKFGIDQSEAAIYLLIDFLSKLYSNPRQTLMTEYVQNARDSHILAGKGDTPFDIHLPTKFNPHYIVRDYGVGMDHNEVENIFAVALNSTKRESNELNGGYGVGKLVFSPYCGVMFLTTWKHGEKTIYQCRLKGGDGEITPIHQEKSDEPQGVEIKIPVPESDFSYFHETAKYVYAFLKTKPNIKGMEFDTKFELETDKFSILEDKFDQTSLASIATIGELPFELSPNKLNDLEYSFQNLLRYNSIVLHFNVGEIDHTPSRDALEYNDKTIAAIKERLEYVKEYLTEYVNEQIESCSSMREARLLYYKIKEDKTQLSKIISRLNISSDFKYDDKNINLQFNLQHKDNKIASDIYWSSIGSRSGRLESGLNYNLNFHPSDKFIVIPADFSKVKISRRIKKYLSDNSIHQITRIRLEAGKSIRDLVDFTDMSKDQFINIEDIDDPVTVSTSSGGRSSYERTVKKGKIFELNTFSAVDKLTVHHWDESDFDYENESGVYVFVKYHKPEDVNNHIQFSHMIANIKKYDPDFKLFGVKTSEQNKIGKNMIHLNDYLKGVMNKLRGELKDLPIKQSVELLRRINIPRVILEREAESGCDVITYFNTHLKRLEARRDTLSDTLLKNKELYDMIANFLGEQPLKGSIPDDHKTINRLKKASKVIENKYPLYKTSYYTNHEINNEYVKAINFYRKSLTKQARSSILSV